MNTPEPYKLCTDVWMVPCKIIPSSSTYKPLISPFKPNICPNVSNARNSWTEQEDSLLTQIIQEKGARKWSVLAKELNIKLHNDQPIRKGKHCRERWKNHLDPDIQKGLWSIEEDDFIMKKHQELGSKWSEISKLMIGRTENQVKNRWNSLQKKIQDQVSDNFEETGKISTKTKKKSSNFLANAKKCKNKAKDFPDKTPENESISVGKEFITVPLRISSINSDTDFQGLPLRISSLTSDPELQSMTGFDFNNMRLWKNDGVDIDSLYSIKNKDEKNEFDQCFANYLMANGKQLWGFGSESGNSFFGSVEKEERVQNTAKIDPQANFFSEFQMNLNMLQGKNFSDTGENFF